MHKRSTALLSTLLMLLLAAGAMFYGAYKGWSQERSLVESHLAGLDEVLSARQEVAANVLTVASRYLPPEDKNLMALKTDAQQLVTGKSLLERARANEQLEASADAILKALQEMPQVGSDDRDLMYVKSMLPQALEQSARFTQQAVYNQSAEEFNRRKASSFSGMLATLLGIADVELFSVTEVGK